MELKFGAKEGFVFIIVALLLADLAILLDVPGIRQIFGFLCFTIVPGFLILCVLKLNKIGCTEKFILSLGLGISFLMLFGLFIDKLYFSLGYETPLSTISLVVTFSAAMILFCIIGYKTNKEAFSFAIPELNLSTSEKAFLIMPILFPALSVFGMYVMNTTDNNVILMFLLFLIPVYVVFVCFFNQKFPKRLYPVVIFLISISVLLLWSLRSNYLLGTDQQIEYYLFQTTLSSLHWRMLGHSLYDACLSVTLLPTICQSILNVNPQYFYKIFYALAFSVSPLIIYIISKKYVEEGYAFLASMFFISQENFFRAAASSRTALAALFFALAMMILFSDKIEPVKKRILIITFMASCIVSHYSTAYVFFFIMLGVFVGIEILAKKYTFKKVVSLTIVVLFFALIFFWYSQVTEAAFSSGVSFFEETFRNLNTFFIEESRGGQTQVLLGKDIAQKGIPHQIQFVFTWLTLAFIGIGIIALLAKRKEMSFPELKLKKPDFLKDKFEVEYFTFALVCAGLSAAIVLIPYITAGYSLNRVYTNVITILSVFFVIGGVLIAKYLYQAFAASRCIALIRRPSTRAKRVQPLLTENASQVWAYLVILVVLIPYFLCVSGAMYNIFGVPRSIILNSKGEVYDNNYIHDQESYCARWLGDKGELEETKIFADSSISRLVSQGGIPTYDRNSLFVEDRKIDGYIYLRYYNVVDGKISDPQGEEHNMTKYQDKFAGKGKIYSNGGSEIYR